ncbi:Nucleoporin nup84 [Coemansia sp. RSA 552]|nr:Nucleoporin nup84 [Coemansia sp. RSA 552]
MTAADVAADFAAVVESQRASLAPAFARLTRHQWDELSGVSAFDADAVRRKSEAKLWKAESSTWDLMDRLYTLRQQTHTSSPSADMELGQTSVTATDFTAVQEVMDADNTLAEYVEIRRWLEETAPAFQPVETRKGYLFYTRRSIRDRGLRPGSASSGSSDQTVTEIDPDATSRQQKELAPEDAEYEAGLLRTLYEYVRRGRAGNAMDLCAESDEPWRAASLKGGLFWRDPRLEPDTDMPVDGEGADDVRPVFTAGNINRALWKHSCAALAHDESNDLYERALYAALSGRLDEVLLVSETWEDFVWAHVNTMIEDRIDRGISDTGSAYVAAQTTSFDHVRSKFPVANDMRSVFDAISAHDSAALRSESSQPFRRLQAALATDAFPEYISAFARDLRSKKPYEEDDTLLRVVVHAALYLRQLGVSLPQDAVDAALESYIECLAKSHRDLVAVYVSHLPVPKQTAAYAQFLCRISDPSPVRMQLLRLAEKHGLDPDAISRRTVALTLADRGSGDDVADDGSQMDTERDCFVLAEPSEAITDSELDQIRAIEWATSSPRLYEFALVETCRLTRQFLLSGRMNAAARLLNSLPDGFVQPSWVSQAQGADRHSAAATVGDEAVASHFHEYIHLLSLCDAYAFYSTWAETLCKRPADAAGQGSRLQVQWLEWKENIARATDQAVQMFRTKLLDIDWLGLQSLHIAQREPAGDSEPLRAEELARLRELYIPESVFRLHSILFDTRDALPQNLKRSLDLAQLVADESLGIYRQLAKASSSHPHGRLPAFMGLMRRSAFEILRIQQESLPDKPPLLADPAAIAGGII